MENTDIPQFHTYRGEIEFEGTLIQADIFIDNKMLEDKNSCRTKVLIHGRKLGVCLDAGIVERRDEVRLHRGHAAGARAAAQPVIRQKYARTAS